MSLYLWSDSWNNLGLIPKWERYFEKEDVGKLYPNLKFLAFKVSPCPFEYALAAETVGIKMNLYSFSYSQSTYFKKTFLMLNHKIATSKLKKRNVVAVIVNSGLSREYSTFP